MSVLLGAHDINAVVERGRKQMDVDEIYVNSEWNVDSSRYDADLAILKLSESVTFSIYIRPICLPSGEPPLTTARIVGKRNSFLTNDLYT